MAHNLFHANYGDYKKSSPDTAVLLLLSKVTQKHFRQPYRPSKVPLRPAGLFITTSAPFPCVNGICKQSRKDFKS